MDKSELDETHVEKPLDNTKPPPRKYKIVVRSIFSFSYIHITALYGLYLCFSAKWPTLLLNYFYFIASVIGVTAGSHRLWSHRSFKAKLPLEILIMIMNTMAFQNTATTWARDHRLHHKYVDTDKDPHNASRGFFYSHIGWLLTRKSDEVIKSGKEIDVSDLYNNPVLRFQRKYAFPLVTVLCFGIPTVVPMYCWGEKLVTAWSINMLRYALNLNATFLINSAAHLWGYKPYDKSIKPTQNLGVSFACLGEGFHNYHHVFPWDYKAAELGNGMLNVTTWFIDFFAWVGWAYDLRKAPEDAIKRRREKTGDSSGLWGGYDHKKNDDIKTDENVNLLNKQVVGH